MSRYLNNFANELLLLNQNQVYVIIIIIIIVVGLYSPIGSALECEANVLRSIHSSSELKGALRGPTTRSDPVGIVDWGGIIFMRPSIRHMWGSTIFESRRLIKVIPICHQ